VDSGVTAEVDDDVREGGLWLHQRERERERERESSRGFWKVTGHCQSVREEIEQGRDGIFQRRPHKVLKCYSQSEVERIFLFIYKIFNYFRYINYF
jgi:hypothetical protein